MKKATYTLTITLAVLFGFTGQLLASDDQQSSPPNPFKIDISGGANLKWVYQDSVLIEARSFSTGGVAGSESNDYLWAELTLNGSAALDDKTSFNLRIMNREDTLGASKNNLGVWFDEAAISVKDFFTSGLTLNFGVIPVCIGSPFFVHANRSETAWDSVNSGTYVFATGNRFMEPGGFHLNFTQPMWSLDLVWATFVDRGGHSRDEGILGATVGINLDQLGKGSKASLLYTVFEGGKAAPLDAHEMSISTIGLGLNVDGLTAVAGLSGYAEYYMQSGDAGRVGATTLDAGGKALRVGLTYKVAAQMNPWISLAYWQVSGDDSTADDKEDRFISYEYNNEFLIAEDSYFGLDIDTNYNSIRFAAGITPSDQIGLTLRYGMFEMDEEIGNEDDLGSEIDFTLTWNYSKVLSFNLTIAQLSGADALKGITAGSDDRARAITFGTSISF